MLSRGAPHGVANRAARQRNCEYAMNISIGKPTPLSAGNDARHRTVNSYLAAYLD